MGKASRGKRERASTTASAAGGASVFSATSPLPPQDLAPPAPLGAPIPAYRFERAEPLDGALDGS